MNKQEHAKKVGKMRGKKQEENKKIIIMEMGKVENKKIIIMENGNNKKTIKEEEEQRIIITKWENCENNKTRKEE